jgi:hypothetical protein
MVHEDLRPERTAKYWMRREARCYLATYEDIVAAIHEYAQAHDISLVLSYRREPINPRQTQSVMRRLNEMVVCHKLPDITDEIIRRLNERDTTPQPGTTETQSLEIPVD